MSHFYGTMQGARGDVTRCGAKGSGLDVCAASWRGAIHTRLWHDDATGVDMVCVYRAPWRGVGVRETLYEGPIHPGDQATIDAHAAAEEVKRVEDACPITADEPGDHGLNPATEEEAAR